MVAWAAERAEGRTMATNQELGARGEELAARHLVDMGMVIVERNWRSRYGELDIIAREGNTFVFVEVKTRSGNEYGTPGESVTFTKQLRIRRLAMAWLAVADGPWVQVRFDVVAIVVRRDEKPVLTHVKSAF